MLRAALSRREFLRIGALMAGTTALAACVPAGAPAQPAADSSNAAAPAKSPKEIRYASFDWFAYVPGIKWDEYQPEGSLPQVQRNHAQKFR